MHAGNMMMEALGWIKRVHGRYWQRRGGRDHIWLVTHDEGNCWVPNGAREQAPARAATSLLHPGAQLPKW